MRQIVLLSFLLTGILQGTEINRDYELVREIARDLSKRPYNYDAAHADLPQSLKELNYDEYRTISYRQDAAVWIDKEIPFFLEFFHRGYLFKDRVEIYLVEKKKIQKFRFNPDLFHYEKRPAGIDRDLGFAGFKIYYQPPKLNLSKEITSFLGASYFRAVPFDGIYGASARGIAVNTFVADTTEEFPDFRAFWIERPEPGAEVVTLYALLDGPSITGAYHFQIKPGKRTVIRVRKSLFLRKEIQALGLAPLTSMFLYGEDKDSIPAARDHRPEVHDSDGLLISNGSSRWLWRPLRNPIKTQLSSFAVDDRLQGFGLLQRDRCADHYNDILTEPQLRPSIWVEPLGIWPSGRVELFEIASNREGMDNIVTQYVIDTPPKPGTELELEYRLKFYSHNDPLHNLARVTRTMRQKKLVGDMEYCIEFAEIQKLDQNDIRPDVTAIGGEIKDVQLHKDKNGYRLFFEVNPINKSQIIISRASLYQNNQRISEIWSDQWKL